ncbi:MAG: DNA primase [Ignavibacteriales bacterium]|nr:DNA primase [Ignavibacteriales bacterium]
MRISPEKIEEIRSANDIVDVVSAHVRLKKRGKNYLGLCPFHQEKTPSFTVSSEKQLYHCFGCGKGGNVFTFVMELEKVSFVEAVRSLAEKVGIVLSFTEVDQEKQSEIETLYNACRFAGLQFYNNLTKTDEGRGALEYFHGRGFSDETIRAFGLGYSMHSWDSLLQHAKDEGIKQEDLQKAGLLRSRDDGGVYDYFRGRAMFPIFSTSGRVIGFGARKMRDDDAVQGKYINSPETPIYNKSRVLFGLFHSKDALRAADNALMVEGYADLISLYQAGIQNVVASSGTALTEEQVQLISHYTKNLTLVYDADSAGSNATLRGVDIALAQDLDVRVVELPEGEDPDSFVQKHGGKEFLKLVEQSISFIDFEAKQFVRSGAFATPEGKSEAVRSIVQSIAKMPDELRRNFFLKDVSAKYDLYESVLHRELEKWTAKEKQSFRREYAVNQAPNNSAGEARPLKQDEIPAAERDILKLLLENQFEPVNLIFSHIVPDDLSNESVKRLVAFAFSRINERGAIQLTEFVEEVEDPVLKSIVTDVAMSKYELSQQWSKKETEIEEADPWDIARGAIASLKKQALQKHIEENQRLLKDASRQGSDTMPFVQRHQELIKQLKETESPEFLKPSEGSRQGGQAPPSEG